MTVASSTQAANILNLFLWEALKANAVMDSSKYSGKIPIIPGGQEPDFTNINAPFIVYGYSEDPSSYDGATRGGTLVYSIYNDGVGLINSIMNVIYEQLAEDDSARRINAWSSHTDAYKGIRFTNVRIAFGEGPGASDQEGGREVATIMMKFDYVATYTSIKKYNSLTNTWS